MIRYYTGRRHSGGSLVSATPEESASPDYSFEQFFVVLDSASKLLKFVLFESIEKFSVKF